MSSNGDINNLIEKTDMISLVSPYVKLQKSGGSYKGLCPFHKEDTPSFFVSQEKHIAKCFGCGKGGNPITFLMQIENIDFSKAVNKLCEINNVKPIIINKNYEKFKKYYDLNELAFELFKTNLLKTTSGKEALLYIKERGITDELISLFNIGLAPKNNALYKFLKEQDILEVDMVDSSLVRNINDKYIDVFSDRIIFSIFDENDNLVGFSGRVYNKDETVKYLNTSDTVIFKKSNILYNLNLAKKEINNFGYFLLLEGYMDVISSYKSGIKTSICQMGTSLTQNQINLIKKYTNKVCLCYDNDTAGLTATKKNTVLLKSNNLEVNIVNLDKVKDADEYIKKYGFLEFKKLVDNQIDYLTYFIDKLYIGVNENSIDSLEYYKKEILSFIKLEKSSILISKALNNLAKKINVSVDLLTNELNVESNLKQFDTNISNIVNDTQDSYIKNNKENNNDFTLYDYHGRIFYYAVQNKDIYSKLDKKLEECNALQGLDYYFSQLWLKIDTYYQNYNEFSLSEFSNMVSDSSLKKYLLSLFEKIRNSQEFIYKNNKLSININTDLEECIKKIVINSYENQINKLKIEYATKKDFILLDNQLKLQQKIEKVKTGGYYDFRFDN